MADALDPHEALHKELSDRYAPQDELSKGGMGEVYKARDTRLDRTGFDDAQEKMGLDYMSLFLAEGDRVEGVARVAFPSGRRQSSYGHGPTGALARP